MFCAAIFLMLTSGPDQADETSIRRGLQCRDFRCNAGNCDANDDCCDQTECRDLKAAAELERQRVAARLRQAQERFTSRASQCALELVQTLGLEAAPIRRDLQSLGESLRSIPSIDQVTAGFNQWDFIEPSLERVPLSRILRALEDSDDPERWPCPASVRTALKHAAFERSDRSRTCARRGRVKLLADYEVPDGPLYFVANPQDAVLMGTGHLDSAMEAPFFHADVNSDQIVDPSLTT